MALAGHFRNCKIFTGYLGCFPSKGVVKKCDFNAYAMREKARLPAGLYDYQEI
ncbi:hypothetical protein QEV69_10120 [Trueperella pyogenes]|uniref:hypothetical protein n=1 Tax=Trueperella pyogenes TaxID=1661 RepID=UPI00215D573B|nr:hypothetical protein [Trueperella pyogenes]UVJ60399.1 hypothetical protein M5C92_03485 [Trueperella pyogenes]